MLGVVSLSLLLSALFAATLVWRQREDEQRRADRSRRLAAHAIADIATPDLALLLSAQALREADIPEARNSALTVLARSALLASLPAIQAGPVLSVPFRPDGQVLATGGADRAVRLWDVGGRRPLGQLLAGHRDHVRGLVFSPDGRLLASASIDGSVILWDVDPAAWRERACASAARSLTRDEWARYVGAVPYEETCPGPN